MSDPLDFLDGEAVDAPIEAAAPEPEAQAQTPEPEALASEPVPVPEPVKEELSSDPRVPLAALHEERWKRQEEERKRQEAEQRAAYLEQFVQPQEDHAADPVQVLQAQLHDMRLEMSKELAKQVHGAELVEQAHQWAFERCNVDPYFNQRLLQSSNPFAEAIAEFQREQIASQVKPDEFQAFLAWKQAQSGVTAQPVPAQAGQPKPTSNAQPRSLASAPSAGGPQAIPTGPGVAFDSVFKG